MKTNYISTKVIELGSCAFRQWKANHSHCRHMHGYQLKAKFWFGCSELDEKNWAVDFGSLKELKAKLQDTFDHTLCVAADDPCLYIFKQLQQLDAVALRVFDTGVGIERVAEFCFNAASEFLLEKYGDRCWVEQVEVFEHQDNSVVYKPAAVQLPLVPVVVASDASAEPVLAVEQTASPLGLAPVAAPQRVPTPAPVGNTVTSGKGNWFAGTTWG
jgi:6-pyruvoyltetrahydropterin/6-carboxytetrahydropterin synthase